MSREGRRRADAIAVELHLARQQVGRIELGQVDRQRLVDAGDRVGEERSVVPPGNSVYIVYSVYTGFRLPISR